MKGFLARLFLCLTVVILAVSLAACASPTQEPESSAADTAAAAPEPTVAPEPTAAPAAAAEPSAAPEPTAAASPAPKVIVDTDMHYLSDDMLALFSLLQADAAGQIELLGITTVGGNVLAAPGTYDTLAILDQVGRSDIPVYMGCDEPLAGFCDLDELFSETPPVFYTGAYTQLDRYTEDYLTPGELSTMGAYPAPVSRAQAESAADFIVSQLRAYPQEVTILALGPCTNIALALQMDGEAAALAKGIYYMGGSFAAEDGADSPAEFNWWYDPDAAAFCLSSNWTSQTIIPYQIGQQCKKGRDVYERYQAQPVNAFTQMLLDGLSPIYDNGGEESYLDCCDPVVSAVFLSPALATKVETRDVVISTERDGSYAVARSWAAGTGPQNAVSCSIVLAVDRDAFWDYTAALYGG